MTTSRRAVLHIWPWILALLVLGPTLRPGYLLTYDMVFVPQLVLRSDFLGLGSGLPRAVPSDAFVAVLDNVVPGALLQRLVLLGALVLAGAGVRRLVATRPVAAQLAAMSWYVWNPFVAERLLLGHWTVLLAYAALPWVADAATRVRRGEPRLLALLLWLVLAATSASGGLTAAVVALAFGVGGLRREGGARRTTGVLLAVLVANAPWLAAGALHATIATSPRSSATVFGASAEGGLPAPLAVLDLGGVWNTEVVPASRLGVSAWVSLVLVLAVCATGARRWWRTTDRRVATGFLVTAAVGLAVALAGVLAPVGAGFLFHAIPGAGLLRDGTRYLGLLALLEAVLFGAGAQVVGEASRDRVVAATVTVGLALAPVAVLPDLAWGALGRLRPVAYPAAYAEVRAALERAAPRPGDLLVLPFTSYRAPAWNAGHKVLDPLGRYMPRNYVASDQLSVSGHLLPGEDPRGRAVLHALARRTAAERAAGLRALGIGLVLVDRSAAGASSARLDPPVRGRRLATAGPLRLSALRGPVRREHVPVAAAVAVGLGFGAPLVAVLVGAGAALTGLVRRPARRRVRC